MPWPTYAARKSTQHSPRTAAFPTSAVSSTHAMKYFNLVTVAVKYVSRGTFLRFIYSYVSVRKIRFPIKVTLKCDTIKSFSNGRVTC